jgi:hypothetical protein
MVVPGMVGRSTEAPINDAGRVAQRLEAFDRALRRTRHLQEFDVLGRDAAGQSLLCHGHFPFCCCGAPERAKTVFPAEVYSALYTVPAQRIQQRRIWQSPRRAGACSMRPRSVP